MRKFLTVTVFAVTLSGCAFPRQVQRFGVEYNEALASMSNQQTLLNILRASKGMPTHFSSVSRFTGTLAMRASGNINGQLRGSGFSRTATTGTSLTTATTVGTTAAPTGLTESNTLVTTPGETSSIINAVAEGVDVYTPQVGGELSSGTAFDVQVFDTQKFYQGILNGVSTQTVEMLLNQGFDGDLVAHLLIARVDVYIQGSDGRKVGAPVASFRNDFNDRGRFQRLLDCTELNIVEEASKPTPITPISRLNLGGRDGKDRLTLDEISLLDGKKLSLSDKSGLSPDGSTDRSLYIIQPGEKARTIKLADRSCDQMPKLPYPTANSGEAIYKGKGLAMVGDRVNGKPALVEKSVVLEAVLRSPEGVLRAVGEIVRYSNGESPRVPLIPVCIDGGGNSCAGGRKTYEPLFKLVSGPLRGALIATNFMGKNYIILPDGIRSMQVMTIIQQLVNLQKESSERALSIPVRAVP